MSIQVHSVVRDSLIEAFNTSTENVITVEYALLIADDILDLVENAKSRNFNFFSKTLYTLKMSEECDMVKIVEALKTAGYGAQYVSYVKRVDVWW